jgi:hypothetical protein
VETQSLKNKEPRRLSGGNRCAAGALDGGDGVMIERRQSVRGFEVLLVLIDTDQQWRVGRYLKVLRSVGMHRRGIRRLGGQLKYSG